MSDQTDTGWRDGNSSPRHQGRAINEQVETFARLLPAECGGPACNHTGWHSGCRACAEWAVNNGVAFARHMSQGFNPPIRRHPETEAQVTAAHAPPTDMETAMHGVDEEIENMAARFRASEPLQEPSIVLTGTDMAAFDEFALAAADLEAHAETAKALQAAYMGKLEALSRMAARRNRGK